MRPGILFATLLLTFLLGTFVQQQLAYPPVWDEIHVGMSYDEVVKRVGQPAPYMFEKGAFWDKVTFTGNQELWIYFSGNKVAIMSIKRRVGTENYGYTQTIREARRHYE